MAEDASWGRSLELPAHRALALVRQAPGVALTEFETDGCSGGMSSAWRLVADRFPDFADTFRSAPPWEQCCVVHDRAYHLGGASPDPDRSFEARLSADQELEACVTDFGRTNSAELARQHDLSPSQVETILTTVAGAMYLAVRVGGGPCSGLPWRWGFGWPDCSYLDGWNEDDATGSTSGENSGDARD